MKEFGELISEFINFAREAFPKSTAKSSLEKCKYEIKEVEEHILGYEQFPEHELVEEYIDCIMCLIDSAARCGYTSYDMRAAFSRKLIINRNRTWKINSDNSYSHIK